MADERSILFEVAPEPSLRRRYVAKVVIDSIRYVGPGTYLIDTRVIEQSGAEHRPRVKIWYVTQSDCSRAPLVGQIGYVAGYLQPGENREIVLVADEAPPASEHK